MHDASAPNSPATIVSTLPPGASYPLSNASSPRRASLRASVCKDEEDDLFSPIPVAELELLLRH